MTLLIIALDALDAGLVDHFDLSECNLGSSTKIETFAYSRDSPYTPEVWATVATGLGPEKHGVTGAGTSEWSNPIWEFGSYFSSRLSEQMRGRLGRFVRQTTGEREHIGHTDSPTIFDREGAVVRNWPGVTNGRDLQHAWDLMYAVSQDMPKWEFEWNLLGLCAEQFGWAREMLRHDVRLAGVHVHTLDAAGHAYCRDEAPLRHIYERVGEFVDELHGALSDDDDLLLLSDHGMTVSFYEPDTETNPGGHSWRAYASATTDDVPRSVYDVRGWVDEHIDPKGRDDGESVDLPVEQLRELGYIE